jgi:hypothetical protein
MGQKGVEVDDDTKNIVLAHVNSLGWFGGMAGISICCNPVDREVALI